MANKKSPDRISDKEQAERETIAAAIETDATGKPARAETPGDEQQGISNRPVTEEKRRQQKLPPRGQAKE